MTVIRMILGCALVAGFPALNAQTPFSGSSTVCTTTSAATGKTVTSPAGGSTSFNGAGTASRIGTWYCLICSGSSQEMQLFATASGTCQYWTETATVSFYPNYTVTSTAQTLTALGVLASSLSQQAYCVSTQTTNQSNQVVPCSP